MIECHTVAKTKVAVTLDTELLAELDQCVASGMFPNRSQALTSALREKLERLRRHRLATACEYLDPVEEVEFAELGLAADVDSWPQY